MCLHTANQNGSSPGHNWVMSVASRWRFPIARLYGVDGLKARNKIFLTGTSQDFLGGGTYGARISERILVVHYRSLATECFFPRVSFKLVPTIVPKISKLAGMGFERTPPVVYSLIASKYNSSMSIYNIARTTFKEPIFRIKYSNKDNLWISSSTSSSVQRKGILHDHENLPKAHTWVGYIHQTSTAAVRLLTLLIRHEIQNHQRLKILIQTSPFPRNSNLPPRYITRLCVQRTSHSTKITATMIGSNSNRHTSATTVGNTIGRQSGQPTKKRRTIGLFGRRPRGPEVCGASSVAPSASPDQHHRYPTPTTTSGSTVGGGCGYGYGGVEDLSLHSRRESFSLSSTSDCSVSLGPAPAGLPDFIIAIPPIPDLRDTDGCCLEDHKDDDHHHHHHHHLRNRSGTTALPTIRSLQAIRRYISPPPSGWWLDPFLSFFLPSQSNSVITRYPKKIFCLYDGAIPIHFSIHRSISLSLARPFVATRCAGSSIHGIWACFLHACHKHDMPCTQCTSYRPIHPQKTIFSRDTMRHEFEGKLGASNPSTNERTNERDHNLLYYFSNIIIST